MTKDGEKSTDNGQLFSRKKSLLSVQQYASSQGISTGVVQECAKLGVVQVRKHKSKTFIVDLPLDAAKTAKQQDDNKLEQIDTSAQAQRISELVNKIFQPAKPANTIILDKRPAAQVAAVPDLNLFAQDEKKAQIKKFEPVIAPFKTTPIRKISDIVKMTSGRKIITVISIAALVVFVGAYSRASLERKAQQQKLQQAYANLDKLMNDYRSENRKAKLLEIENQNWQTEAQRNQKAAANLETELLQTKEQLTQTQEDLSKIQQKHVDTLRQLNEQINQINTQINPEK